MFVFDIANPNTIERGWYSDTGVERTGNTIHLYAPTAGRCDWGIKLHFTKMIFRIRNFYNLLLLWRRRRNSWLRNILDGKECASRGGPSTIWIGCRRRLPTLMLDHVLLASVCAQPGRTFASEGMHAYRWFCVFTFLFFNYVRKFMGIMEKGSESMSSLCTRQTHKKPDDFVKRIWGLEYYVYGVNGLRCAKQRAGDEINSEK